MLLARRVLLGVEIVLVGTVLVGEKVPLVEETVLLVAGRVLLGNLEVVETVLEEEVA